MYIVVYCGEMWCDVTYCGVVACHRLRLFSGSKPWLYILALIVAPAHRCAGYAVIGIGSTDKDGAGGFGLEFPNNGVINHANPTPCAHEDSRDHAYIKVALISNPDSLSLS